MKKIILIMLLAAIVLGGLIFLKIKFQNDALNGPLSGSGVIESVGVDLSSRVAGRVQVAAKEGSVIKKGDTLLQVNCDEYEARLAEARANLLVAQSKANGARLTAGAAKANSRVGRARARAARAQQELAKKEKQRIQSMGEFVADAQKDKVSTNMLRLNSQYQGANAARDVFRSQMQAAQKNADAAQGMVPVIQAKIKQVELLVQECRIVSPMTGVVERVYFSEGELVLPGKVVARVVQVDTISATFYVPNDKIGEIRVGDMMSIQADTFESDSFEGKVSRVALEAEFTPRNVQTRSDRDRLVFPVEVLIQNLGGKLRAGMPVTITSRAKGR